MVNASQHGPHALKMQVLGDPAVESDLCWEKGEGTSREKTVEKRAGKQGRIGSGRLWTGFAVPNRKLQCKSERLGL